MLYLNLPLQYYVTLLYIVCSVIAVLGFYFVRKINDSYIKLILIWTIILLELNFINMIFTLKNYIRNSKKIGKKGPRGNRGPRGLNGFNTPCNINACKKAINAQRSADDKITDNENFAVNVNDNQTTIDSNKLKIGKCIFPFIHNHVFKWNCVKTDPTDIKTQPFEDEIIEASVDGWCATELNADLSVKKYGYCNQKVSNSFELSQQQDSNREDTLDKYIDDNYGVTEMKIISGINSDIQCPKGYTKIPKDLNSGTDGYFVYLCKKIEMKSQGIGSFKVVKDIDECPADNPLELRGNLNEGNYNSPTIKICAKKVNTNFISDIVIKDKPDEIEGYVKASDNINEVVSDEPIYLFYSTEKRPGIIIDNAFVWGENNKVYFFKDKNYWKFDNYFLEKDFPKDISSRWGNLPENIDAVFTNPNDNKTYFFDGTLYYEYDYPNQKIKDGFPKFIKDYWDGIPENNIDAVFVDKNKGVYFIKDKYMYEWDDESKKVVIEKTLADEWENAPNNVSSMFSFNNKVYITQSNKIYVYDSNTKKLETDSPKNINTIFQGI